MSEPTDMLSRDIHPSQLRLEGHLSPGGPGYPRRTSVTLDTLRNAEVVNLHRQAYAELAMTDDGQSRLGKAKIGSIIGQPNPEKRY